MRPGDKPDFRVAQGGELSDLATYKKSLCDIPEPVKITSIGIHPCAR